MINIPENINNPQTYAMSNLKIEEEKKKTQVQPIEITNTDVNQKKFKEEEKEILDTGYYGNLNHNNSINNPLVIEKREETRKTEEINQIKETNKEYISNQNKIENEAVKLNIEDKAKTEKRISKELEQLSNNIKDNQIDINKYKDLKKNIEDIYNTNVENGSINFNVENINTSPKTEEEVVKELKDILTPTILKDLNISDNEIDYKVDKLEDIYKKLNNKIEEKTNKLEDDTEKNKEYAKELINNQKEEQTKNTNIYYDPQKAMKFLTNMLSVHSDLTQQKILDLLR